MGLEGGELLAVPQASRIIARAILLPIAFGDEEIHRRASSTKAPESGSSKPSRIPVWSEAGIQAKSGLRQGAVPRRPGTTPRCVARLGTDRPNLWARKSRTYCDFQSLSMVELTHARS